MAELPLPAGLSAGTFPAKLWRLVNSPRVRSVRWDSRAQGLLIDRCLLERELLSSGHAHRGRGRGPAPVPHTFRATQFRSFVRQLYRYGFRKVPGWLGSAAPGDAGAWLHYSNPCFRRDRPDLLLRIERRSAANRQRPAAGREGRGRPPCGSQQLPGARPLPDGRHGRGRFTPLPTERPPLPPGARPAASSCCTGSGRCRTGGSCAAPGPAASSSAPGSGRCSPGARPAASTCCTGSGRCRPGGRGRAASRSSMGSGRRPPSRRCSASRPATCSGCHGERPLPLGPEGPRSRSQELYGEQLPPAEREVLAIQPCSFQQLHREQQPPAYDARATPGTSGPSAPAGSAACAAWTAPSSAQNAPGEEEWPPADLGLAVEKMIREIRRSLSERSPSAQDNVGVAPDSSGGEPVNRAAAEEAASGSESCRNSSQEPEEPDAI
ncbi:uncharacterized protein GJ701_017863 isoform 1-T2 [Geothlypis trichas]